MRSSRKTMAIRRKAAICTSRARRRQMTGITASHPGTDTLAFHGSSGSRQKSLNAATQQMRQNTSFRADLLSDIRATKEFFLTLVLPIVCRWRYRCFQKNCRCSSPVVSS
jgi:hypothetical protein